MSIKWANISKSPQIGTWHLILLFTIIVITIILLVSLQGTPFLPHQEASISSSMGWGSWKPKSGSDESCRLFALCTVKPPLSQEIRACFPYGKWKEKIMNHYLQRSPCQLWWWFYDCMYLSDFIERYTLNWWNLLYANSTSIKLTKNYPATWITLYSKKLFWGENTLDMDFYMGEITILGCLTTSNISTIRRNQSFSHK